MTTTEKMAQELQASIKTHGVQQPREPEIGRFGKLWIRWMEETHPKLVMQLLLNNSFYMTAEAINLAATQAVLKQTDKMLEQQKLPDDPEQRAAIINGLRASAEEQVKKQILQITPLS